MLTNRCKNTKESKSHATNDQLRSLRPPRRKRFYRDPDSKVLGGRMLAWALTSTLTLIVFPYHFALMAVGLCRVAASCLYFILWFATPEAVTAAEKLEMRGERVDLNNIKATVQEEMNTFRSRMEKMGDDVRNFSRGPRETVR